MAAWNLADPGCGSPQRLLPYLEKRNQRLASTHAEAPEGCEVRRRGSYPPNPGAGGSVCFPAVHGGRRV